MARQSPASLQRIEILTAAEVGRTLDRLASQVLEAAADPERLLLVGIPTRGIALAKVLASRLEVICGQPIPWGSVDPTFHRDDLERVGTRLVEATELPSRLDGGQVDRGHRELPIQPDFCGRMVPTSRQERIELRLRDVDGADGVDLLRPLPSAECREIS